jgi:hypothetical protein
VGKLLKMTLLFSLILGMPLAAFYEYLMLKIPGKKGLIIKGYRLHHSIYGLIFITMGLALQSIFCIGLGLGILIQHTLTDGFRFISKEKQVLT